MTESSVRELITTLIKLESITPNDGGCQNIINDALRNMGFDIVDVSSHDVTNTFARFGNDGPLLVFAGHTDVVPPGPLTKWISPPFEPTIRDGSLWSRCGRYEIIDCCNGCCLRKFFKEASKTKRLNRFYDHER